jgi:hypothetical protein
MLKTAEVEIKKEHNMLMVNKSVEFKKSRKKTKGNKVEIKKEIKKEHNMLMVNKSIEFKKSRKKKKGNKGKPKKGDKSVVGPSNAPKHKPRVMCFYCKDEGHGSVTAPSI